MAGENPSAAYCSSQIRAAFYPKFENEKSDQEIRTRMIELISNRSATLEVTLKHSGSLFMYSGDGKSYAKNSYGNVYTAVGVFILAKTLHQAWGHKQYKSKQIEFNTHLENNQICVSMELVTAVLGDHGQRPKQDYLVVTAVTELGNGKPRFYSTPEVIGFCRKWRLPTNNVWLFKSKKSVTSFFATYDALCEEGIATTVCKALDQIADISVPGSKDHVEVQGEILEGLVARVVSRKSKKYMRRVLKEFPIPALEERNRGSDFGLSLREIFASNRENGKQQIKALLDSVGDSFCSDHSAWLGNGGGNSDSSLVAQFLEAQPVDYSTMKVQEIVRLMREKLFKANFKCYNCSPEMSLMEIDDSIHFKMIVHVNSDLTFQKYQKVMKKTPGLWPLYRGFFIDIRLFYGGDDGAAELDYNVHMDEVNASSCASTSKADGLSDEDANLMIKLKFLTYKLRTFLIRNGLSILFKKGPTAYRTYYLKQMNIWNISSRKQRELGKMLDEWVVYIKRKCGDNHLTPAIYLSEAEPFLEQYATRSPENQALIGSAGNFVRAEDILAIIEGRDEEGDLDKEWETTPSNSSPTVMDSGPKRGLIVFFPGIPGCGKSALCKEILASPSRLEDDRPVHSLMGDLTKGKYWQKINDELRRKPCSILLADKNAPNEEVWMLIEDMSRSTRASVVPVIPDSEGTATNPFSLDALAVFIFRVIQRANHPGRLDKASPNPGYVLLMFYKLYDGKNRSAFESELAESFGSLVKMPLLKEDRSLLPDSVRSILEEGLNLYKLHTKRHGKLDSLRGSYSKEWVDWENRLQEVLFENVEYLNAIQVPFDLTIKHTLEQLIAVAKNDRAIPDTKKRKLGTIVYAAITLSVEEIRTFLESMAQKTPGVEAFLKGKDIHKCLERAHVTLAHKKAHGVTAVASYGVHINQNVPVELTALLFSNKSAALEVRLGSVGGEKIIAKNSWPHVTIWTAANVAAKEANALPQLYSEGEATRIDIIPPPTISGTLDFY